nr:MAG TPA: hypothetical protein [Caudoviricetes sp.]
MYHYIHETLFSTSPRLKLSEYSNDSKFRAKKFFQKILSKHLTSVHIMV